MDNASKALTMAGAVLIALVLVSIGVYIVTSINPDEPIKQLDEKLVAANNEQFIRYTGSNKSANEVKTLMNLVQTHNANGDITVTYGTIKLEGVSTVGAVETASKYKIDIPQNGYDSNGCVSIITITKQ